LQHKDIIRHKEALTGGTISYSITILSMVEANAFTKVRAFQELSLNTICSYNQKLTERTGREKVDLYHFSNLSKYYEYLTD